MSIDPTKLDAFMGKMLGDMGAAATAALVVIGDKLGLYKGLAEAGSLTPAALAERTGTASRYVAEWLAANLVSNWLPALDGVVPKLERGKSGQRELSSDATKKVRCPLSYSSSPGFRRGQLKISESRAAVHITNTSLRRQCHAPPTSPMVCQ